MSKAIIIDCNYQWRKNSFLRLLYCELNNDPIFDSHDMNITKAKGYVGYPYNIKNVRGFQANNKTINYFPQGLNLIYNLTFINITDCKLQEIQQSNLQVFPYLKYLILNKNEIKILEKKLFKFNHHLEFIDLSFNQINEIYPTIFDHLSYLWHINLNNNSCGTNLIQNPSTILNMIEEIKNSDCNLKKDLEENSEETIEEEISEVEEINEISNESDDDSQPNQSSTIKIEVFVIIFVLLIAVIIIAFFIYRRQRFSREIQINDDILLD
ncbi:hypothetical protein PVAND_009753 [Polypedilum vanderplanki]|uniref:Uncharacterized protein n=1 Tax=Polypedilum vanderplanki TaxID=319348 RepID=A0A9J6CF29_POLVA|nr:hypothetical protein PVAND_009753 [Polypedilum vanderplanki]